MASGGLGALTKFLDDRLERLNRMSQRLQNELWVDSHADRLTQLADTAKNLGKELSDITARLRKERSSSDWKDQASTIDAVRGQCEKLTRIALKLTIFLQQVLEQRDYEKSAPRQTAAQMKAERNDLVDAIGPTMSGVDELIDSLGDLRAALVSGRENPASIRHNEVRINIERYRRDDTA